MYMEEALDLPLRKTLKLIQAGIIGEGNTYLGIRVLKSPMDAWVYQQIIHKTCPDVIIEIGNKWGGSALMLQHLLDRVSHGRVIGIDHNHSILHADAKSHPEITFIEGDGIKVAPQVIAMIGKDERVMIIEDSAHTFNFTLEILKKYSPLVKSGYYFIIEDSIMNHGLVRPPEKDPYRAVEVFVDANPSFEIDRSMEKFFVTWNPKGYLRRR